MFTHSESADSKLGKKMTMITRLSRNQKQNRRSVFFVCILINVGKHAETKSLKKMHFKRKYFSKICSEQILTRVKIYLHKMGYGRKIVIIFTKQITYRYLLSHTNREIII